MTTRSIPARLTALAALLLIPVALLAAPVPQKNGRISGKVTGPGGEPLEGVKITITTPANAKIKLELSTPKDGTYATFLGDATYKYHFVFAKAGFTTHETDKKVPIWNPDDRSNATGLRSEDHSVLDVTLVPAAAPVPK